MPDISESIKKLYNLLIKDPDYQDTPTMSREEIVLREANQRNNQHIRNNIALSLAKSSLLPSTNGHTNGDSAVGKLANFLLKARDNVPRPPSEGLISFSTPKNGITTLMIPLKQAVALREFNKDTSFNMSRLLYDLKAIFEGVEVEGIPVDIGALETKSGTISALMKAESILGNQPDISSPELQQRLIESAVLVENANSLLTPLYEKISREKGIFDIIQEERMGAVEELLELTYDLPAFPEGWQAKCLDGGKIYPRFEEGLLKEGAAFDLEKNELGELVPKGEAVYEYFKSGLITPGSAATRINYIKNKWATLTNALETPEGIFHWEDLKRYPEGRKALLKLSGEEALYDEALKINVHMLDLDDPAAIEALSVVEAYAIQLYNQKQARRAEPELERDAEDRLFMEYLARVKQQQLEGKGKAAPTIKEILTDQKTKKEIVDPKLLGIDDLQIHVAQFFQERDKKYLTSKPVSIGRTLEDLAETEGDFSDPADAPKSVQEIQEEIDERRQVKLNALMEERFDDWEDKLDDPDVRDALEEYNEDSDLIASDYKEFKAQGRILSAGDGTITTLNIPKIFDKTRKEHKNASSFRSNYYRENFGDVSANGWLGQEQDKLKDIANRIYTIEGVTEVFLYGDSVHDYRFAKEEPADPQIQIGIRMSPDSKKYEFDEKTNQSPEFNALLEQAGIDPKTILPSVFRARYYSSKDYDIYGNNIVFADFKGEDFPKTRGILQSQLGPFAGTDIVGSHDQQNPLTIPDDVLDGDLNKLLGAQEGEARIVVEDADWQIPLDLAHRIANQVDPDIKDLHGQIDTLLGTKGDPATHMDNPIFTFLGDSLFPDLSGLNEDTRTEVKRNLDKIFGTQANGGQNLTDRLKGIKTILHELREKHKVKGVKELLYVHSPEQRRELRDALHSTGDTHILEGIVGTDVSIEGSDETKEIMKQLIEYPQQPVLTATGEQAIENGELLTEDDFSKPGTIRWRVNRPGSQSYKGAVNKEINEKIKELSGKVLPNARKDIIFEDKSGKRITLATLLAAPEQMLKENPTVMHLYTPSLIHNEEGDGSGRYKIIEEIDPETGKKTKRIHYNKPAQQAAARARYLEALKALTEATPEEAQAEFEKNWSHEPDIGRWNIVRDPNTGAAIIRKPGYFMGTEVSETKEPREQDREPYDYNKIYSEAQTQLQEKANEFFLDRFEREPTEEELNEILESEMFQADALGYTLASIPKEFVEPEKKKIFAEEEQEESGVIEQAPYAGNINTHNFLKKTMGYNPDTNLIEYIPSSTRMKDFVSPESTEGLEISEEQTLNDVIYELLKREGINTLAHQFKLHTYSARRPSLEEAQQKGYSGLFRAEWLKEHEDKQKQTLDTVSNLDRGRMDAVLAQWDDIRMGRTDINKMHLGISFIGADVGMEVISEVIKRTKAFPNRTTPTITLRNPETPKELAEAERRILNRNEFHRGRPFEFDLTDPDFQTFMKHVLREKTDWNGTSYNDEQRIWETNIPDPISLSKRIINSEGKEKEVPIGDLGGIVTQLKESLGRFHASDELDYAKIQSDYIEENPAGANALAKIGTSDETFRRRVLIDHFIRKQLEGEVEESELSELIRIPYGQLLAGLELKDIEASGKRVPLSAPAAIRAYSDADALAHAEDGENDVGKDYFADELTYDYFKANYQPFLTLAKHLNKQSVRDLFEEENLVPTDQTHMLRSIAGGGFELVPTTGQNKIEIGELKTFLHKYMSHSKWGTGARSNADSLQDDLKIGTHGGHLETKLSAFDSAHEILPAFYSLTQEEGGPLHVRKFFNLPPELNPATGKYEPVYNATKPQDNPLIAGDQFTVGQVMSFPRQTKKGILQHNLSHPQWTHRRMQKSNRPASNKAREPGTDIIDFTELNAFLQRNLIGLERDTEDKIIMGVDAEGNSVPVQALKFDTDVRTDEVDDVRRWINEVRAKVAMLKAIAKSPELASTLTEEDRLYWKALTGAATGPKGQDLGHGQGYRLDALLAALGHPTLGEGNLSSFKGHKFIDPRIGGEGDELDELLKSALKIYGNAETSLEGTTYQTNLNYQDDLLARIGKTLGNMPEDKLKEFFGEHIGNYNRLDPLGIIVREVEKITRRGETERERDSTFDFDKYVNNEINILLNTVYDTIGPYNAETGKDSSAWNDQPLFVTNDAINKTVSDLETGEAVKTYEMLFDMEDMTDISSSDRERAFFKLQAKTAKERTDILDELSGDKIRIDAVMGTRESVFTDREREILQHRYGLFVDPETGEQTNRPKTLQEIANIFGVERERIRQIEKKALQELQGLALSSEEQDQFNFQLNINRNFSEVLNNLDMADVRAGYLPTDVLEQLQELQEVIESAPEAKFPDFIREGSGTKNEFNRPFEQGRGPVKLGSPAKMGGLPAAPAKLELAENERRNFLNTDLGINGQGIVIQDVYLEEEPKKPLERYHIRVHRDGKLLGHLLRDNGTYSVYRAGEENFVENVGKIADNSAPVAGVEPIYTDLSMDDAHYKIRNEIEWISPIDRDAVTAIKVKHDGVEKALVIGYAVPSYVSEKTLEGLHETVITKALTSGASESDIVEVIANSDDNPVNPNSTITDPETGGKTPVEVEITKIAKKNSEKGAAKGTAGNRADQWGGEHTLMNMAMRWHAIIGGTSSDDTLDHAKPMLKHLTSLRAGAEGPSSDFPRPDVLKSQSAYLGLNVQNLKDISDKFEELGLHGGWRADGDVIAYPPRKPEERHVYSGMSAFLTRLDNLMASNMPELVGSELFDPETGAAKKLTVGQWKNIMEVLDELPIDAEGKPYSINKAIAGRWAGHKMSPDWDNRTLHQTLAQTATSTKEIKELKGKDITGGFVPPQIAQEIERLSDPKKFPENQELTPDDLRKQVIRTMDKDNKIGGIDVAPWKVSIDTAKAILKRVATDDDFRGLVESNNVGAWDDRLYLTMPDPQDPTGKRQIYNEDFLGMTNQDVRQLFEQLIGEDGQVKHHDSILGHAQPAIEDWTKHNFQAWDKAFKGESFGAPEGHDQHKKLPRTLREHQINGVLDKMAEGTFGETDDMRLSNKEIHDEHMTVTDPQTEEKTPRIFTSPPPTDGQEEVGDPEVEVQPDVQPEVAPTQGAKEEAAPSSPPLSPPTSPPSTPPLDGDGEAGLTPEWDALSDEAKTKFTEENLTPETFEGFTEEDKQEALASIGIAPDSRIAKIMRTKFKDAQGNPLVELDREGNLKKPHEGHQDYLDHLKALGKRDIEDKKPETGKLEAAYVTQYINKIGEDPPPKVEDVSTDELKEEYKIAYKKRTASFRNPNGIDLDPVNISNDPNTLRRDIDDLQRKDRIADEAVADNIERTKANDLSKFMPEGGVPEGLSARMIKQLALEAYVHQGKYDVESDSKGKPFMENESKEMLLAFWDDITARTDAQGNPLVTFDEMNALSAENNYYTTYTNREGKEVRGHALEEIIDKEYTAMEEAEANHTALVTTLNEEGVEALNYPVNGHNILISPNGQDELELGANGEFNYHEGGRNRDAYTGNLLDKNGEKRITQAPQVFGLNFEDDEDKIRFKELWNKYYQISNKAVRAHRGQESAGYAIKQQQELGQQIVDEYGSKGFEQEWLRAARVADEYGPHMRPIERNKLGFPLDEKGNPIPLPKVIDPETGDEVDGWYSPALHAVVNERYLRTLFEESTKHKTNPLYGDHSKIKITPTDLRRRGAGRSVGANLEDTDDPRLQLIQPLPGSPLNSSKAMWFTREGGMYHVPSLTEYSPPAKGPIDSAAFRRLVLMHKVADEMAQNPEAFTGNMADLYVPQEGFLDAQQWAGDQEAMAKTPTVKRMVRNSPSAKQTIKEQTDNLQASPTARFLASLGGYTKETAGRVPTANILTALARDTLQDLTGHRLIPATIAQKNIEMDMAEERRKAETMRQRSEQAETLGMLDPTLISPRDPKEKQVGVGEYPAPRKHPFEQFKPEYIPEVENPLKPLGSAVGALGRFARRDKKPEAESIAPLPSLPVEDS